MYVKKLLDFITSQVRNMERPLDIERGAPVACNAKHGPHADQSKTVQETGFALQIHIPKESHQQVNNAWQQAVKLVQRKGAE